MSDVERRMYGCIRAFEPSSENRTTTPSEKLKSGRLQRLLSTFSLGTERKLLTRVRSVGKQRQAWFVCLLTRERAHVDENYEML